MKVSKVLSLAIELISKVTVHDLAKKFQVCVRTNFLFTSADPHLIAEFLKKIFFTVVFTTLLDETSEFADMVLPERVFLERPAPFVNWLIAWQRPDLNKWY